MYIAVLSSNRERADRLGDRILRHCLQKGCYSTFLSYTADDRFLEELTRREFSTVVLTADGREELLLAEAICARSPRIKLVLLGTNKAAVEGYALDVSYCAGAEPGETELDSIATVIFPPVQAK
ncbi:MAG: hypothetical protein IJZ13_07090 [Clostridia bacterium]|nr:hypothetical protein [Clostridia bacterium]